MNCGIIGIGTVGQTFATLFARAGIEVGLADTRGAASVEPVAREIGGKVLAMSLDKTLEAEIVVFAVQFVDLQTPPKRQTEGRG